MQIARHLGKLFQYGLKLIEQKLSTRKLKNEILKKQLYLDSKIKTKRKNCKEILRTLIRD